MTASFHDFDIIQMDSAELNLKTPVWMAARLASAEGQNVCPAKELKLRLCADGIIAANLFKHPDMPSYWVLDMAALTELPALLAGYLVGLKHDLRSTGSDLALLWMSRCIVPCLLADPLMEHFSLRKKGMFFVTERALT